MFFLRRIIYLTFILSLIYSCAKISYIVEQGQGQWALIYQARDNQEVLQDQSVSQEIKEQIKKVESFKRFFYRYMDRPTTEIYSKTTFLKGEAVTHLVIASPINQVKAYQECFPLGGCFPYLGFFEHESAKRHALRLEKEHDLVTVIHPIYAYSTTGHLNDPILSSFFRYKRKELAELIFHELFHTILFIKDEVELNENLATYVSQLLVTRYFKLTSKEQRELERKNGASRALSRRIVYLVKLLNQRYRQQGVGVSSPAIAAQVLEHFLKEDFYPQIKDEYRKWQIDPKNAGHYIANGIMPLLRR